MAYVKTNWTSTTPINATNLNKIEDGLEQTNKVCNYSTEEQAVGTWNGKPLYRKTITTTGPTTADTDTLISNTLINNIKEVTKIDGIIMGGDISYPINYYYDSNYNSCAYYYPTGNNGLKMKVGASMKSCPIKVIIEYTKTTD